MAMTPGQVNIVCPKNRRHPNSLATNHTIPSQQYKAWSMLNSLDALSHAGQFKCLNYQTNIDIVNTIWKITWASLEMIEHSTAIPQYPQQMGRKILHRYQDLWMLIPWEKDDAELVSNLCTTPWVPQITPGWCTAWYHVAKCKRCVNSSYPRLFSK